MNIIPDHEPEQFFATYGVTPIIHYDPLLRVIRTDLPMLRRVEEGNVLVTYHVHSKVEFPPWEVTTHDANDTVLESEYYGQYATLTPAERVALDKAAAHAGTPSTAHLDTLARQFRIVQRLGLDPMTDLVTNTVFDITGKPLSVTDARGNVAFQYVYDMAGAALRTQSIDAGDDRVLANVMGNPVRSFDAKGHTIVAEYDALHRPVKKSVSGDGFGNVVERLVYGEGIEGATDKNLRGRLYQHYDQAGRMRVPYYDLHGQPGRTQRKVRTDYKAEANWPDSGGWNAQLDAEVFQTTTQYDALSRVEQVNHPDGSKVRPLYHQSNRPRRIRVMAAGESTWSNYVVNIKYNAKSQRELILYGNATRTDYRYDDATFRLERLRTKRTGDDVVLQLINYLYDPVGNIVRITDDSHEKVFSTTGPVSPVQNYTYDALYRLTHATGRMHNALGKNAHQTQADFKANAHLNDITQMSEYRRDYFYDYAGNLHTLRQTGTNPFTRYIKIAEDSNKPVLNTADCSPCRVLKQQ